jgi:hypothetical protein
MIDFFFKMREGLPRDIELAEASRNVGNDLRLPYHMILPTPTG